MINKWNFTRQVNGSVTQTNPHFGRQQQESCEDSCDFYRRKEWRFQRLWRQESKYDDYLEDERCRFVSAVGSKDEYAK
ncbi:hypothetical protein ACFXTH_037412 [Malus domestica]